MPATQVLQQRNQRDPLSSPFKSRFKKCARQDITVPGNLVGRMKAAERTYVSAWWIPPCSVERCVPRMTPCDIAQDRMRSMSALSRLVRRMVSVFPFRTHS